jgi:hypothetical protein
MTLTIERIVVPDLDLLPVTVDELDAVDTPIWDELADRWAEVQAVQAEEVAK